GGFQGSLTGRENTRFVCRINGVTERGEMREITDYVEDFAEIGDYFDMPVKTYSSGMRARLGFGVSMAFEFDWYLIDEVMAVGDQSFRGKCEAELERRRGTSTFIIASHNLQMMRRMCDIGIIVRDGAVTVHEIGEAVEIYSAQ
ncbi:MAG: ABC transporter ATP-binding protein, partial [Proteobacteria bacterium]|nr:ABC transporter ATP-binding protein [Pseudomonadota bacterium]